MGKIPVNPTTNIEHFPKVLRRKWEAYSDTSGRHTTVQKGEVLEVCPFPQGSGVPKVLQLGNGQNTVSRALFRLSSAANSASSLWHTTNYYRLRGTH